MILFEKMSFYTNLRYIKIWSSWQWNLHYSWDLVLISSLAAGSIAPPSWVRIPDLLVEEVLGEVGEAMLVEEVLDTWRGEGQAHTQGEQSYTSHGLDYTTLDTLYIATMQ